MCSENQLSLRPPFLNVQIMYLYSENQLSLLPPFFITTMAALPVPALAPAVIPTPDLHEFKYSDLFKATEDEISAIA